VFIVTATAICSLWHGLRTYTAVPGSTQLSFASYGVVKSSTRFGWGKGGNASYSILRFTYLYLLYFVEPYDVVALWKLLKSA